VTFHPQHLRLIGVPLDLGAGRRGVDMGPSALRIAGVGEALAAIGHNVEDIGNLLVAQREELVVGDPKLRYLAPIADVCRRLHAVAAAAVEEEAIPIALGGDHSLAVGSVSGVSDAYRRKGERVGVIWLDAHGDMNTAATTPSGNVHGMPLSALMGDGPEGLTSIGGRIEPNDVALVGIRAIDEGEARTIRQRGVHAWTMRDVDGLGLSGAVTAAIDALSHCDWLHVSFDVDYLDPTIAPGVGTRVRGGPNYREAHLTMELLAETERVRGIDVVELNPILDRENASAELAVELLQSLLGKRIL
jgi:arginase